MELNRPAAVLFDWDNTLVDTWPIIHQALHDTMMEWGMAPWSLAEVKLKVGKSLRDAFPDVFGADWEKAGAAYTTHYRKYQLQWLTALPDVLPVLEYVRSAVPFVGIVSNKRGESLRTEITHMKWDRYFDVAIGANDAANDKPHTDPAVMALAGSGVEMGRDVWFIGDTITDLECAQAGGMTGILYGDVEARGGTYRGFPYAFHVPTHRDLLALLKESC